MPSWSRTYRDVDGERVEGTWRPIFIHNGPTYFLTDLLIFADGSIHCWEWVNLEGLRDKLRSGWVATTLESGADASAHHLASWKFAKPQIWITAEQLLGEVADEIDRLNNRPDSTGRCLVALDEFLASRSEADRLALRASYHAIPEHLRLYALGDMDAKDWPLRVLVTDIGDELEPTRSRIRKGERVTEESRVHAFEYFAQREAERGAAPDREQVDRVSAPEPGPIHLSQVVYRKGWPSEPRQLALRNEYPSPLRLGRDVYPTVTHAYAALSTSDETVRRQIREEDNPYQAAKLAEDAILESGWSASRLALMAALMRTKYQQHADLADVLLSTGESRIYYSGLGDPYWESGGDEGRNWIGRLLELVRSELAATQANIDLD